MDRSKPAAEQSVLAQYLQCMVHSFILPKTGFWILKTLNLAFANHLARYVDGFEFMLDAEWQSLR